MKLHHLLGGAAIACLLAGAFAAPAFAANTGSNEPTGASVDAGDLTATLAGAVTFPGVAAAHTATAAANQLTSVDVNDLTGSNAGWTVTIIAGDLDGTNFGANPADLIPAANVSIVSYGTLAPVTPLGGTAPSATGITAGALGAINADTTLLAATVGNGVGEYTQPFTLGLNVPADTLTDVYAGTVTVTVAPAS